MGRCDIVISVVYSLHLHTTSHRCAASSTHVIISHSFPISSTPRKTSCPLPPQSSPSPCSSSSPSSPCSSSSPPLPSRASSPSDALNLSRPSPLCLRGFNNLLDTKKPPQAQSLILTSSSPSLHHRLSISLKLFEVSVLGAILISASMMSTAIIRILE